MIVLQIFAVVAFLVLAGVVVYAYFHFVNKPLQAQRQQHKEQKEKDTRSATHRRLLRANLMPETPAEIQSAKPSWEAYLRDMALHIRYLERVQSLSHELRAHTPVYADVVMLVQRDRQDDITEAISTFREVAEHLNTFTGVEFPVGYQEFLSQYGADSHMPGMGIAARE